MDIYLSKRHERCFDSIMTANMFVHTDKAAKERREEYLIEKSVYVYITVDELELNLRVH